MPSKVVPLYNFVVISLTYCSLTFTDGALRTIILLYCTTLGFTPLEIAAMFMLYEFAGIGTNLLGGILAAQKGLKYTGCLGLILMALSLVLVAPVQSIFGTGEHILRSAATSGTANISHATTNNENLAAGSLKSDEMASTRLLYMFYIIFVQGLAGVGKDLMKISGKSITKLVNKKGDNGNLFKMVVYVTGAKNTIKGIGTFMGGVVLLMGYWQGSLLISIFVIVPLPLMLYYVDNNLGVSNRSNNNQKTSPQGGPPKFRDAFTNISYNVGMLSGARFWLFGARDVWFEIAFPIFLKNVVNWPDSAVSAAMGMYIIIYGILQGYSPKLCLERFGCQPPKSKHVAPWTLVLGMICTISGFLFLGVHGVRQENNNGNATLTRLINQDKTLWWTLSIMTPIISIVFAIVMAVLSSVHSYLIVLYSGRNKVAKDVGFYYMSNAGGRLIGTLLSGILCEYTGNSWGLIIPLWVSCIFLLFSGGLSYYLRPHVLVPQALEKEKEKGKMIEGEESKIEMKTIESYDVYL